VFDAARRRGFDDPRLHTTMISIYCKERQDVSAESVFRTAVDAGAVDGVTFDVLATWYARGGAMDRAERTLCLAETRGVALDTTYVKLADAYLARNEYAESWRLLERARRRGTAPRRADPYEEKMRDVQVLVLDYATVAHMRNR
jgi:pentatricopeptide repeat protein